MASQVRKPLRLPDEYAALRSIVEGTATETGEQFFAALVKNLAEALNTHGAWVTEYLEECRRLRALSFWMGEDWIPDWEIAIDGTPCQEVVDGARMVHYPDNILALYPQDSDLRTIGAVSYLGVPLKDPHGKVLGHLAVMDTRPMPEDPRTFAIIRIFAARAGSELLRLRAEQAAAEREQKLASILGSAMDAFIEFDDDGLITFVNPAGEKLLSATSNSLSTRPISDFFLREDLDLLNQSVEQVRQRPPGDQCTWIPGMLTVKCCNGESFFAEATLSLYRVTSRSFHVLSLRNVNDRIEAERRIRTLSVETEYLRQELREARLFGGILGTSKPIQQVLEDISQVAGTDASVLIYGETGTGKELVARAIHEASNRKDRALVKVNCAAIPAMLMESEFFGHEKGAFTGATSKREGRFALADGGTIFLDEVGELSLDLQAKLLRVLQEGEFEPVGSSVTRRVNVRVIAATNRDLNAAIKSGQFREDLYYRLNVFPLHIPPLRERGNDIIVLADSFARRIANEHGRVIAPLTAECARRLTEYSWPGNVRELQNVIERAVITARDGQLNLARALGPTTGKSDDPRTAAAPENVMTCDELKELECKNITRALESCGWKIAGEQGAAKLLGISPSTLTSRIKALGITRSP
ncbi:MAG: sigma 54-interacting transcriptional regulator [Candidatus Hydrogenedentes bacterium]|nr:sigma 54-interacting transcriptional regulator [Candidatus Hydrogenedentota bacterium]